MAMAVFISCICRSRIIWEEVIFFRSVNSQINRKFIALVECIFDIDTFPLQTQLVNLPFFG